MSIKTTRFLSYDSAGKAVSQGLPSEERRLERRHEVERVFLKQQQSSGNTPIEDQNVKSPARLSRQDIVDEARGISARLLELTEHLATSEQFDRAEIREELKALTHREQELRNALLDRRAELSGDDLSAYSIRMLRAFARDRARAEYVVPEVAIAINLADQLEASAKRIDLSQRYLTNSSAEAEERHRRAIEYLERHLAPALRLAEKQAEHLDYGRAIAHGNKQTEALSVWNRDLKRGLSSSTRLLQTASHQNNHSVNPPRLSISEGAGGGL